MVNKKINNNLIVSQGNTLSKNGVPNQTIDTSKLAVNVRNGLLPVGSVISIMADILGTSIPATGVVLNGFMLCDGAAIPAGQALSGILPDLTNNRLLKGVASGADNVTGGSTSLALITANLPAHNHLSTIGLSSDLAHQHSITTNNNINGTHNHTSTAASVNLQHAHAVPLTNTSTGSHAHDIWTTALYENGAQTYAFPYALRGATFDGTRNWTRVGSSDMNHSHGGGTAFSTSSSHTHTSSFGTGGTTHTHSVTAADGSFTHSHTTATALGGAAGSNITTIPLYIDTVFLMKVV